MLFGAFLSLPSLQAGNAVKNLFRAHEFPGMRDHPQNARVTNCHTLCTLTMY